MFFGVSISPFLSVFSSSIGASMPKRWYLKRATVPLNGVGVAVGAGGAVGVDVAAAVGVSVAAAEAAGVVLSLLPPQA